MTVYVYLAQRDADPVWPVATRDRATAEQAEDRVSEVAEVVFEEVSEPA